MEKEKELQEELQEMNECEECAPSVMDSDYILKIEPTLRWLRVQVGSIWFADTRHALLVKETGKVPLYYFPKKDVRFDLLSKSGKHIYVEHKGVATFWDLKLGEKVIENAVWGYESPEPEAAELQDYVTIAWSAMDHWYEESEEVFGHARDPYVRVEEIASSRRVQVTLNGMMVADSTRPVIVFETNLMPRYYLPAEDIRMDLLIPSDLKTRCPYKGEASYWSVQAGDKFYENVVWGYPEPVAELPKIKGMYSFYNEKIDRMTIDGMDWQDLIVDKKTMSYPDVNPY